MHVVDLLEARYANPRTIFYYEFYPHYSGRQFSRVCRFDANELRDIAKNQDFGYLENACDSYAIHDAIFGPSEDNIAAHWKSVEQSLQQKGTWVDYWEEGTHALSVKSMRDAVKAVIEFENNNFENNQNEIGGLLAQAPDGFPDLTDMVQNRRQSEIKHLQRDLAKYK